MTRFPFVPATFRYRLLRRLFLGNVGFHAANAGYLWTGDHDKPYTFAAMLDMSSGKKLFDALHMGGEHGR